MAAAKLTGKNTNNNLNTDTYLKRKHQVQCCQDNGKKRGNKKRPNSAISQASNASTASISHQSFKTA